jgi:transcriptional regulator with XRE-family HTH domain
MMAGSELRRLRLLAGQSQFELARESGMDRTRISLVENDHVQLSREESKRMVRAVLDAMRRKMVEVEAVATMSEAA